MPRPKLRYDNDPASNRQTAFMFLTSLQTNRLFSGITKVEKDAKAFIDGGNAFRKISEHIAQLPAAPGEETGLKATLVTDFNKLQECFDDLQEFAREDWDENVYNEARWNDLMDKIDSLHSLQGSLDRYNEVTGYRYSTEPFMSAAFGAVRGANTVSTSAYQLASAQYLNDIHDVQVNLARNMEKAQKDLNDALIFGSDGGNIIQLEKDFTVLENIQKDAEKDADEIKPLIDKIEKMKENAEKRLIYEAQFKVKETDYLIAVQKRKAAADGTKVDQDLRDVNNDIRTLAEFFKDQGFEEFVDLYKHLDTLELQNEGINDPEMNDSIEQITEVIEEKIKTTPAINNRSLAEYGELRARLKVATAAQSQFAHNLYEAQMLEQQAFSELKTFAEEKGLKKNFDEIQANALQNDQTLEKLNNDRKAQEYEAEKAQPIRTETSEFLERIGNINKEYRESKKQAAKSCENVRKDHTNNVRRYRTAKAAYNTLHDQRDQMEREISSLQDNPIDARINGALVDFTTKLGQNKRFLHFDSSEFKAMGNAIKAYQNDPSQEKMQAIQAAAAAYIDAKMRGRENDTRTTSMRDYRLNVALQLRDFAESHTLMAGKVESRKNELKRYSDQMEDFKDLKNTSQSIGEAKMANVPKTSALTAKVEEGKQYKFIDETRKESYKTLRTEIKEKVGSIDKSVLNLMEHQQERGSEEVSINLN